MGIFAISKLLIPAPHIKKRNPNGFEPLNKKYENKILISGTTETVGIPTNEQHHHVLQTTKTSDASSTTNNTISKAITCSGNHQSKAHSKRARNRSLEMVIDDEKADSSPSRSR